VLLAGVRMFFCGVRVLHRLGYIVWLAVGGINGLGRKKCRITADGVILFMKRILFPGIWIFLRCPMHLCLVFL